LSTVSGAAVLPLTVTLPSARACTCMCISNSVQSDTVWRTHVVLGRPISELGREDFLQLPIPPSLLAVGVVRVVVGLDPAQPTFKVVWDRPWIAWSDGDFRGLLDGVRRRDSEGGVDGDDSHAGCRYPASSQQVCSNARRRSQE
jgi:hypothetical protein